MNDKKNQNPDPPVPEIKKESKYRDDTPSFIRNVESRAELLKSDGQKSGNIPVLTMPRSVIIWRRIRWPFFVTVVIIILATVAFITNDFLVARSVLKTIADAQYAEEKGVIQKIQNASTSLLNLAERHPGRANAQTAWAWQAVLHAKFLGPEQEMMDRAKTALKNADNDGDPIYLAAQTVVDCKENKIQKSLKTVEKAIEQFPGEPRLKLAAALCYFKSGKSEKARELLSEQIESNSRYLPFYMAALEFELAEGTPERALELNDKLLALSPSHLYGTLVQLALLSPAWGDTAPNERHLQALIDRIAELHGILENAPPKFAVLGYFLSGQVHYIAGNYDRAIEQLHMVMKIDPNAETLAYLALARASIDGPVAALKLLDSHRNLSGPEILDVRAQCLLDYHRIGQAAKVIERLEKTGKLKIRVAELKWILAVRQGDIAKSLESLPENIKSKFGLVAAEHYFILKNAGHWEGILKLTKAMEKHLRPCATTMILWHGNKPSEALQAFWSPQGPQISCREALSLRLLRKQVPLAKLQAIADRVHKAKSKNLLIEIDRALTIWPSEGYEAAMQILDSVWGAKPQGEPIQRALAKAYLEMDKPKRALEVLKKATAPSSIALRIHAARASNTQDTLAAKLVKQAVEQNQTSPHPALALFALENKFVAGSIRDVSTEIEPLLPNAGEWTDELAEIAAKTLFLEGQKLDADKLLTSTARQTLKYSGLDESWEVRLLQVKLTLRRGGKFMYRALHLLEQLREEGVKHPTLHYYYALAHLSEGNDRFGLRFLRDAIDMDPTYKPAYAKLAAMERLDEKDLATLARLRPNFKPQAQSDK